MGWEHLRAPNRVSCHQEIVGGIQFNEHETHVERTDDQRKSYGFKLQVILIFLGAV